MIFHCIRTNPYETWQIWKSFSRMFTRINESYWLFSVSRVKSSNGVRGSERGLSFRLSEPLPLRLGLTPLLSSLSGEASTWITYFKLKLWDLNPFSSMLLYLHLYSETLLSFHLLKRSYWVLRHFFLTTVRPVILPTPKLISVVFITIHPISWIAIKLIPQYG